MFYFADKKATNSRRWNRFKSYWLKQWKPANISVYGIVDRTNNFAESLNKSLNVLIGARHPNIWKLIERLKLLDLDYSKKIQQASKGKIFREYKKQLTTSTNKQIKSATEIFDRTKDIERFLQNVTYDIRLDVLLKERLNINEMDEDEKHDYDEIVPNSFNPKTTRKRKNPEMEHKKRK